jgi:hypothetical protein
VAAGRHRPVFHTDSARLRPGPQSVDIVGLGEHHHVLGQLAAGQLRSQRRIDQP